MSVHTQSDTEPRLHYQDEFRLAWEAVPAHQPTPQQDTGHNLEVLRKLISLQRSIIEKQDSGPDVRADLQLLDNKLNMALDLLGDLYQTLHHLPPRIPVDLCSTSIEWLAPEPPNPDARLILRLYLSDHYPRPLIFTMRVVAVDLQIKPCRIHARFEEMDAPIRDELERLIFLLHRHSVAKSRHP